MKFKVLIILMATTLVSLNKSFSQVSPSQDGNWILNSSLSDEFNSVGNCFQISDCKKLFKILFQQEIHMINSIYDATLVIFIECLIKFNFLP